MSSSREWHRISWVPKNERGGSVSNSRSLWLLKNSILLFFPPPKCRQNSVKSKKQSGREAVSTGRYWKHGLHVFVVSECILTEQETHTHTYVHTYTVHVTMASTGRNPTPTPPPHHAFLHHESLYHNSGICQGADVLPAESRHHRVLTGWRKRYCQHM